MPQQTALVIVVTLCAMGCSSREEQEPQRQPSGPAEPHVSADLEPFLTSYFASWSAGDMDAYRDHFHPRAMIYLLKSGEVVMAQPRDPFVDGQEAVRAGSKNPGVEKMTSFEAHEDKVAATVTADWELVQGEERTVGVDRFTLIRDEQWRWKIIALLFYSTAHGEARPASKRSKAPKASSKLTFGGPFSYRKVWRVIDEVACTDDRSLVSRALWLRRQWQ